MPRLDWAVCAVGSRCLTVATWGAENYLLADIQPLNCSIESGSKLKARSRRKSKRVQLEASGSSFSALLANAPSGDAAYIDSGDILEESKRRAGGMKIRMQHYFKRQA